MCAHKCEYCYLQTNQTPEHYFYTNFLDAEHEIAAAPVAHTAILTLWTHLENYMGVSFDKLPDRFKETSDWLRDYFSNARINRDERAIDTYYGLQGKLVQQLNKDNRSYQIDIKAFRRDRETIKRWYQENLKYNLNLTCSEFTDFLAVDHLIGNSSFLMQMVAKYPRVSYTLRTKSANVDEILQHDGCGRLKIQIGMNTDYAIRKYEYGTASLDERIDAARKVQQAKGFTLDVTIEPMMMYKGYEKDYVELVRRVLSDLDPTRIHSIIFGTARYALQLIAMARLHFPNTTLFEPPGALKPPVKPDTKSRYDIDLRIKLYSTLLKELAQYPQIQVKLGSEEPSVWKALQLDKAIELGKVVSHQNNNNSVPPTLPSPPEKPMNNLETESNEKPAEEINDVVGDDFIPTWHSISTQDISDVIEIHLNKDQGVPLDKALAAYEQLKSMMFVRNANDENPEEVIGVSVIDDWSIEEASTIAGIIKHTAFFKPVKIVGRIVNVLSAEPHEMEDGSTLGFIMLEVSDHKGDHLKTLLIDASKITIDIKAICKAATRCTFFGSIVPEYLGKGKSEFRFLLHDIIPSTSHIDLVERAPQGDYEGKFRYRIGDKTFGIPNDHPSVIIKQNGQLNGVIQYIKNELIKNFGIVGLDKAQELDRAIEFVILQAFSHGKNEYLEKLHALVIGTPNVGKAYLTNTALALNPIGQEISSSSQKITPAGLIGVVKTGKKNKSEPGILPQNNGGVVCIQEFHDVRVKYQKRCLWYICPNDGRRQSHRKYFRSDRSPN
jgi:DNA repair photolyase